MKTKGKKNMSTDVVKKNTSAIEVRGEYSKDQIDLIKSQIAVGCTDGELALFVQVCQRTGLDPFARQIYAIKRVDNNGEGTGEKMVIAVSIDGLRLQGQRSGNLNGQEGPFWCGEDGVWQDVWLKPTPPAAAKVIVHRRDCQYAFTGIALWSAYAQKTYGMECPKCKKTGTVLKSKQDDGYFCWAKKGGCGATFAQAPGKMVETYMARWGIDGAGMLGKCAEALANRKAFPAELSGLYTTEELGAALDIQPDKVEVIPQGNKALPEKSEVATVTEVLPPATPTQVKKVATVPKEAPKTVTPVLITPATSSPAVEAVKTVLGGKVIDVTPAPTTTPVAQAPVASAPAPEVQTPTEPDNTPLLDEATKSAILQTFAKLNVSKDELEAFVTKPITAWTMKDKTGILQMYYKLTKK